MPRISSGMVTKKRRKKILKLAKGYWGSKSKHFKMAKQAVMKSGNYAFVGRKRKKRDFRRLWITRISAACRLNGISYSVFIKGLKDSGIILNRKIISEIAILDINIFKTLLEKVSKKMEISLKNKKIKGSDDIVDNVDSNFDKASVKV